MKTQRFETFSTVISKLRNLGDIFPDINDRVGIPNDEISFL